MPIIKSLLDTDMYKYSMQQYALNRHPHLNVKYGFHCRTPDVLLTEFVDIGRLREEFDHVCSLRFTLPELAFLARQKVDGEQLFKDDYIDYLHRLRLYQYDLSIVNDTFRIEFEGSWAWTMLWETICLSIFNELYFDGLRRKTEISQQDVLKIGLSSLAAKELALSKYPELKVTDFGTRRRYSRLWQEIVIDHMLKTIPEQLAGTSNAYLAWQYGLPLIGTMAHEIDQAEQGVILKETDGDYSQLVYVRDRVMDGWENEYPYGLRINLPDTFSSDWALDHMTDQRLQDWKGERHDSGDPYRFTERRIERWRKAGIDPKAKWIVYSDGLEVCPIIDLWRRYSPVVNVAFGWGTDLTNNVGFKPISIVVKLIESAGYSTVKISDNLSKAIGKPEDVERVKQVFGLTEIGYKEVKY